MAHNRSQRGSTTSSSNDISADDKSCIVCSQPFARKDKVLQCGLCESFFHIACQDIDDQFYEAILKDRKKAVPMVQVYCSKQCNKAVAKYMTGVAHLEKEVKRLGAQVASIDSTVSKLGAKVADLDNGVMSAQQTDSVRRLVREEIEEHQTMNNDESDERIESLEKKVAEAVTEAVNEIKERNYRSRNVMVFGVPMSTSTEMRKRIEYDNRSFNTLCHQGLKIKERVSVRRITRLGKKEDKDRPMRVTLNDQRDVGLILRSAKNLKTDKRFENVSVSNDSTPLEREQWKKLKKEKEEKQAEADENGECVKYFIKRGKLRKEEAKNNEEEGHNEDPFPQVDENTLWG